MLVPHRDGKVTPVTLQSMLVPRSDGRRSPEIFGTLNGTFLSRHYRIKYCLPPLRQIFHPCLIPSDHGSNHEVDRLVPLSVITFVMQPPDAMGLEVAAH